jgi:ABC-2 type transport system permease protein
MTHFLLPTWTLFEREVVRFLRQRNRVIGAIASPLMFWFLIGSGMGRSFRPSWAPPGFTYLEYFFPGTILLMILFTSIFSTISIIEDRREGFLQAVLAAPVARGSVVLGKVLGGATLATLQGLVLCLLAPFAGLAVSVHGILLATLVMFVTGCALTALGYLVAWPMQSVQGFHAIMNLFLMPLWLLSGALFPSSGAVPWLRFLMDLNPLHYGLIAMRRAFYAPDHPLLADQPGTTFCLLLLVGVTLAMIAAGVQLTRQKPGRNP